MERECGRDSGRPDRLTWWPANPAGLLSSAATAFSPRAAGRTPRVCRAGVPPQLQPRFGVGIGGAAPVSRRVHSGPRRRSALVAYCAWRAGGYHAGRWARAWGDRRPPLRRANRRRDSPRGAAAYPADAASGDAAKFPLRAHPPRRSTPHKNAGTSGGRVLKPPECRVRRAPAQRPFVVAEAAGSSGVFLATSSGNANTWIVFTRRADLSSLL